MNMRDIVKEQFPEEVYLRLVRELFKPDKESPTFNDFNNLRGYISRTPQEKNNIEIIRQALREHKAKRGK